MSELKHTPGPWDIINGFDKDGKGPYFPSVVLVKDPRYGVGRIVINVSHDQEPDSLMANAKLIAAAPDMLETLISASPLLELLINIAPTALDQIGIKALDNQIKAAIDKATK